MSLYFVFRSIRMNGNFYFQNTVLFTSGNHQDACYLADRQLAEDNRRGGFAHSTDVINYQGVYVSNVQLGQPVSQPDERCPSEMVMINIIYEAIKRT
jgi:hypothetical protein